MFSLASIIWRELLSATDWMTSAEFLISCMPGSRLSTMPLISPCKRVATLENSAIQLLKSLVVLNALSVTPSKLLVRVLTPLVNSTMLLVE